MNGDGYDDVVVSAPTYINGQKQEGRILVFHGSATGLAATPDWSVEGNRRFAKLGTSVACAGDVNGDGFADVVAGAPGYDNEGRAFLYLGSPSGLATVPVWTGSGASPSVHSTTRRRCHPNRRIAVLRAAPRDRRPRFRGL